MESQSKIKLISRLTWLALLVSLISLSLFWGILSSPGDVRIALGLILLLLLYFVSAPIHGVILIMLVLQRIEGNKSGFRWVYFYFVLTLVGHLSAAASQGAFEELTKDIAKIKRKFEEPDQVKLEDALRRGPPSNIEDIKSALANGANPDGSIDNSPVPFLVRASNRADLPVIKALLDAGADPNKRSLVEHGYFFGGTIKSPLPLDAAAFSSHDKAFESIQLLIAAGAEPSKSVMKLAACWKGDLAFYDFAMAQGATGMLDANGKNCLHYAAHTNQLDFLQAILFDVHYEQENAKAMLTSANRSEQYPLDIAISEKHIEAALIIVKAGGIANKLRILTRVLEREPDSPALEELKVLLRTQ